MGQSRKLVRIIDFKEFERELEWFEKLKKAAGYINEDIISHCDRWRLSNIPAGGKCEIQAWDSTVDFIMKRLNDFGILADDTVRNMVETHFLLTTPNYYTIKAYLLELIKEAKDGLDQFKMRREAAFVFIPTTDGEVLMVTRKGNDKFGLPGGKLEYMETPMEACIRETKEETGQVINPDNLELIFAAWCGGFWCSTYLLVEPKIERPAMVNKEDIKLLELEAGVIPTFIPFKEMLSASEFMPYNAGVFESFAAYCEMFFAEDKIELAEKKAGRGGKK